MRLPNTWWTRVAILAVTLLLVWAILGIRSASGSSFLQVGQIATHDYRAQKSADVVDRAATEQARQQAADQVEPIYDRQYDVEKGALAEVDALFLQVRDGVLSAPVTPSTTSTITEPSPTTSSAAAASSTTSTVAASQVGTTRVTGKVFVDVNGNGTLDAEPAATGVADAGLPAVTVNVLASDGETYQAETQSNGTWAISVPAGDVTVTLDSQDPDFPAHFHLSTGDASQTLSCKKDSDCATASFGLAPDLRPEADQVADLTQSKYGALQPDTLALLVRLASGDVVRQALGQATRLDKVQEAAQQRMQQEFNDGIYTQSQLVEHKSNVRSNPPLVYFDGQRDGDAGAAAADIVNLFLQVNETENVTATQQKVQEARAATPEKLIPYQAGQLIIAAGAKLQQVDIDAIDATDAANGRPLHATAMGGVLAVLLAVLGYYLARFRPNFWDKPLMVALFGTLIVLGALAVRGTAAMQDAASPFILPAVAFGYLASVLFDNRMGTLMALTMAILVAVGTRDVGLTVFALLATLAPIGFVSALSSRRAFRNSVLVSSVATALIAGVVAWFFFTNADEPPLVAVGAATAWAFGASVVAALVALAALPFFESVFDVTTTLRILELTDRNHEALQLIQAKAFGTFNHSLMVGTLADAAARAIGANNLLARAAAYYHDIGKTENPTYYIENQFGIPNPHDELPPEESAAIIRQHVLDGVRLAKQYKIPSEVAEGIVTHHGHSIMRYFYEKARSEHGDDAVDPEDYRHAGHKPRTAEMAIVMLADSLEAACRASFVEEEPTPEAIEKVVDRVIDEKVTDGQLDDSAIMLVELTKARRAFIEALVGHYHQRIPYPNFPGS